VPTLASCSFNKRGPILIIFDKQRQHIFKNDMFIQLFLSLHFYLLYLLLNSCDRNDAFWRHCMLVKQSSSFSRKHWILCLQICVRQTVGNPVDYSIWQLMQECVYCTRHTSTTPVTLQSAYSDTWASISQNVEAVGHWRMQLYACVKAKGHHFEHLLNQNRHFSQPTHYTTGSFQSHQSLLKKTCLFCVISGAAI